MVWDGFYMEEELEREYNYISSLYRNETKRKRVRNLVGRFKRNAQYTKVTLEITRGQETYVFIKVRDDPSSKANRYGVTIYTKNGQNPTFSSKDDRGYWKVNDFIEELKETLDKKIIKNINIIT